MTIRPEIAELARLGQFPPFEEWDLDDIKHRESLVRSIVTPVTDDEARALLVCFAQDDGSYGLGQTLRNIIETGPGGCPLLVKPGPHESIMLHDLWDRYQRWLRR